MEWEECFSPSIGLVLPRPGSNHSPILLQGGVSGSGPKPFRFQLMWLLHLGFKELVDRWWHSFEVDGPSGQKFRQKLKLLREKLRAWNKDTFGNVEVRKASFLEEIRLIDDKEETSGLSEEDKAVRHHLKEDFERVLCMEEMLWKQKSKV